jgi:putative heme-binding domain-containing protein
MIGKSDGAKVEKIPAKIGMAQGLLWAFDCLYVVVNGPNSGLYKVTSSQKNDTLDTVELLRAFEGGNGEHGPHAVMMHPDGKRLTVVCGDQTKLVKYNTTKVPPFWGEDHLLPRLPDGNGFMKDTLGPGGAIYNVTPDGKNWELYSVGYRNEYDAAYNKDGDLFTFDADMEWDFNTPWYRPTRICLATSGSEFGWRNGAGKYPPFYIDNLPPIMNVGPGSPTGVCFGYGAKFPKKYQDAFFMCDWSYGKLYAVHLTPDGSAYKATMEEFLNGTPLPLTDIVISPVDGAMYFTIGGRKTKSGLYRVTYTGKMDEPPPVIRRGDGIAAEARTTRLALEKYHQKVGQEAVDAAWKELDNADRYIRFAARVAIEHQDPKLWADRALAEKDPLKAIPAILALTRVSAPCPEHTRDKKLVGDPKLRAKIVASLTSIDFAKLTDDQKLDLVRTYEVVFNRFGRPLPFTEGPGEWDHVVGQLGKNFPDKNRFVNGELCEVLIALDVADVAPKAMRLLKDAPTQEEQLEYVRALRMLKSGWTPELRKDYFLWFVKAANYKGGNSFQGFLRLIKADAVANLTAAEKVALKDIINANPATIKLPEEPARPFVKAWKVDDMTKAMETGFKSGRDFDRGRKLFATAKCFGCHRYDNEGGSNGPDLTGVSGRFSPRDLLESIVEPSKEISDQYAAVEIRTTDERIVIGRIVNLNNDTVMVNTDMLNPGSTVSVDRKQIASMKRSKLSMMPSGLVDTFKEDEILDLMAYILSRGDRNSAMFKK